MSRCLFFLVRRYSRSVGHSAIANRRQPVIRVSNSITHLGRPKEGAKPSQLLSLPPFPGHPLPGKKAATSPDQPSRHVTAISWIKYYFDEIPGSVIQSHFNKGLVSINVSFLFLCEFICIFSLTFPPSQYMVFFLSLVNYIPLPGIRCTTST